MSDTQRALPSETEPNIAKPRKRIRQAFFANVRMTSRSERRLVSCLLLVITAVVAAASYDRERLETAKQILEEVPLTDGHNDLPWNIRKFLRNQINEFELDTDLTMVEPWSKSKYSHTDLPRLRQGMVGAQIKGGSLFKKVYRQNREMTIPISKMAASDQQYLRMKPGAV